MTRDDIDCVLETTDSLMRGAAAVIKDFDDGPNKEAAQELLSMAIVRIALGAEVVQ